MSFKDILEDFVRHTDSMEEIDKEGRDGFERDFADLKQRSMEYRNTFSSSSGQKSYNGVKNRYKDILPFDYTRVALQPLPGMTGSDYINANFVKGASGYKTYIAAQAPLPASVIDFWRMLWEQEIKVVVMACNLREAGKTKCEKYWPELEQELNIGIYSVVLVDEDHQSPDYTLRELEVRKGNVHRTVYQLHYTAWPDHGVPDHYDYILDLVAEIREKQPQENLPVVIHCSAGCGRTGTIIAIDYCWSLLKKGKLTNDFSLFDIIDNMRQQRPSAVQTPDQYWFVFMAVKELFERHLHLINKHSYENIQVGETDGTSSVEGGYGAYETVDVQESKASIQQEEDDYAIPEPAHSVAGASSTVSSSTHSPHGDIDKSHHTAAARIPPAEVAIEKTIANLASMEIDSSSNPSGKIRPPLREQYVNVEFPKHTPNIPVKPETREKPYPAERKSLSVSEATALKPVKPTVARKPSYDTKEQQSVVSGNQKRSSSAGGEGGLHVEDRIKSFEQTQSIGDGSSTSKKKSTDAKLFHQDVTLSKANVTAVKMKENSPGVRFPEKASQVPPIMPYAVGNVHMAESSDYEQIWPNQAGHSAALSKGTPHTKGDKEDGSQFQSVTELRQKLGSEFSLGTMTVAEQGKKSASSEDHQKKNAFQKIKSKISSEMHPQKSPDQKNRKSVDEGKEHNAKNHLNSSAHQDDKAGPLEQLKSAFQLSCGSCVSVDPVYAAAMQSQNAPTEKPLPQGGAPSSNSLMMELKAAQGVLRTAEHDSGASPEGFGQQLNSAHKTQPVAPPAGGTRQAVPYAVSSIQTKNPEPAVGNSQASSWGDIQPYATTGEFAINVKTLPVNKDKEGVPTPYSTTTEMDLFGKKKQECSIPSKSSVTPPVAHEYAEPFLDTQSTISTSSGEYAEPYSTTRELFNKRSFESDVRLMPPAQKVLETTEPDSCEYSYSYDHFKQNTPKAIFDNSTSICANPKAPPRKKKSSHEVHPHPQKEGTAYEPVLLKNSEQDLPIKPAGSKENRPAEEPRSQIQRCRKISDDEPPPPIPTKSLSAFQDASQVKSNKRHSWDDKIWAEKYSCPPPVPIKTPEAYMLPRVRGNEGVDKYPSMTRSRSSADNKYHSLERNFFSKKDVSERPEEIGPEYGGRPKGTNLFERFKDTVLKGNKGLTSTTSDVSSPAVFIPVRRDSDENPIHPSHLPHFKALDFPTRNDRKPKGPRPLVGAWKLP